MANTIQIKRRTDATNTNELGTLSVGELGVDLTDSNKLYVGTSSGNALTGLPTAGGTLTGQLFSQTIRPSANATFNLGVASSRYAYVYGVTGDFSGDLDLADNSKIKIGDSDDLQLYHDGFNSYVHDNGTGDLILKGDNVRIKTGTANDDVLRSYADGAVELYHNDVKKFETTSTGATVTGNLTVGGAISLSTNTTPSTAGGEAFLYKHSSNGTVLSGYNASIETGSAGSRSVALSVSSAGTVTVNNNLTVAGSCTFAALSGTSATFSGDLTASGITNVVDFRIGNTRTNSHSSTTAAWYNIAGWGSTSGTRGGKIFVLSYTGGNFTPVTYVIKAFKNWAGTASLILEKHGNSNYITKVRIAHDGSASPGPVYKLQVYLVGDSNGHSFRLYEYNAIGYNGGLASEAMTAVSGSWTTATERDFPTSQGGISTILGGTINGEADLALTGADHTLYSGESDNELRFGRGSTECMRFYVNDYHAYFDLIQDADQNQDHYVYFRNQASGTGARGFIFEGGPIGIGMTPNTAYDLDVNGASRFGGNVTINNSMAYRVGGDGTTLVGSLGNTSGVLSLKSDGTRDVQIGSNSYPTAIFVEGSNGFVGIGCSDPGSKLTIESASAATSLSLHGTALMVRGPNNAGRYSHIGFTYNTAGTTAIPSVTIGTEITDWTGHTKGELVIGTRDVTTNSEPTERFRIKADGKVAIGENVGIGVATPLSSAGIARFLHIGSANDNHSGIVFQNADTTKAEMWLDNGALHFWRKPSGSGDYWLTLKNNGDVDVNNGLIVGGAISLSTNTTPSTAGGEAFLYKHSSNGTVLSGYNASIETGSAGSRSVALSVSSAGTVTVNNNLTVAGSCTFAALSGTSATFSGDLTASGITNVVDFRIGNTRTNSHSSTTAAWYNIAGWGSTSGTRGGKIFVLSYTGGNFTPVTYVIKAFKNWAGTASLILEKHGNSNYITKVRIAHDGSASPGPVYKLQVYLVGDSNGHSFRLYEYNAIGYNGGLASEAMTAVSGSWTTATERDFPTSQGGISTILGGTINGEADLALTGADHTLYSGESDNELRFGRGSTECMRFYVNDYHAYFDLIQDADQNQDHYVYFRNQASGTGARGFIFEGGPIGIGMTPNTAYDLDVNGASRFGGNVTINNSMAYRVGGDGTTLVGSLGNTSGVLSLKSDGTRDVQIGSNSYPTAIFVEGSNGFVGIGCSDPGSKLTIESASAATSLSLHGTALMVRGPNNAGRYSHIGFTYNTAGTTAIPSVTIGTEITDWTGHTKGELVIGTRDVTTNSEPTERFRIKADGKVAIGENVGIGVATPLSSAGIARFLHIGSANDNHSGIVFQNADTTKAEMWLDNGALHFWRKPSGSGDYWMTLKNNGDVDVNNGLIVGSSLKLSNGNSLHWDNENTRILASHASQYIRFDVGGTSNVMYATPTGLGIGVSNPSRPLQIGDGSSGNVDANGDAIYLRGDTTLGAFIQYVRGGQYNWRAGISSGSYFHINDVSQSNATRLSIAHTTGYVQVHQRLGIGIAAPYAPLQVNNSADQAVVLSGATNPYIRWQSGSSNKAYVKWENSTSTFVIRNEAASQELRYNSTGLGVGVVPSAKLHIAGSQLGQTLNDYQTHLQIQSSLDGNTGHLELKDVRTAAGNLWTTSGRRLQMRVDSTHMAYIQWNGTGNNYGMSFGTGAAGSQPGNVTEAMRIDVLQRVGIGVTPSARLHIKDSVDTSLTSGLVIERSADAAKSYINTKGGATTFNNHNAAESAGLPYRWYQDGTHRMSLTTTGLGINHTNPSSKIHVHGGSKFFGGGDWTNIERVTTTDTNFSLYVTSTSTASNQGIARFTHSATAGTAGSGTETAVIARDKSYFYSKLGVGLNNPSVSLDIVSTDAAPIKLYRNSGNCSVHVKNNADDVYFGINDYDNVCLGHNLDQTAAPFQLTSSGSLGLGTASPSAKLHVAGDIKSKGDGNRVLLESNDYLVAALTRQGTSGSAADQGGLELYNAGVSKVALYANTTSYINNGANFGIGTAIPSAKLHVVGGGSADVLNLQKGTGEGGLRFTFNGTNYVSYIRTFESATTADNYMAIGVSNGNNTTGAEVMRLTGDGSVGIGADPSAKLHVNGDSYFASEMGIGMMPTSTVIFQVTGTTNTPAKILSTTSSCNLITGSSTQSQYTNLQLNSNSGDGQIWKAGGSYTAFGGASSLNIYCSNGKIAFHPSANANKVVINTDGDVDIADRLGIGGAHSDSYQLYVNGTSYFSGAAEFDGGIKDKDGELGTSGHVLHTNGSDVYWAAASGGSGSVGKVTKVVTWNYPAGNDAGVSFSGSNASGTATITHNLGTQYVVVSAVDIDGHDTTAAGEQVDMGYNLIVKTPTTSTITLHWDGSSEPSSSAEFRVTIIG